MNDEILTLAETAKRLRVSLVTLWRMHAKEGLIPPPIKVSKGKKGYYRSTLDEYLVDINK